MGGSLLSTWLHHQVLSIPVSLPGTFQIETGKLPLDSGKAKKTFDVILERNIFHAQKTEIVLPPSLPDAEILAPKTEGGDAVEHTRLAIALAGTMIYGKRNSFAFISKKDNLNKYVIYGIGECFNANTILRDKDCAEESVKVLKIRDRWVLILYQGKKQALWMVSAETAGEVSPSVAKPVKAKSQTLAAQKTTALIVSPQEKVVTKTTVIPDSPGEGKTLHFKRVWVDEQLANFEQLLNDARVIPTTKDGKPYFMFQYIKEESIYQKLGLKKNDIILEINGFRVDSVDKALKLLEVLQSEREISLKVEREGKPVQFHYYID
ncbi:MAG TPA: general secretion pathway protein GspC [Candidatus Lambdaproteobacteria bacterium]|nr:general secretion pathway protein GspC [Candidatus Lambdaproteobacteria bacterium]HIO61378.1 general secretion pathway protein GspC [Deltaproteobacteria bacterium]HIA56285.1 general secretion pathway protein GspC [Candidatus Lambdaproteobacteria bacterium]HIB46334.1 general secretion pathway protein GspC [Candidatus Lambdaproteobacteria bacterium]HIB93923.1 general secretion pathway protein GspC [Candidatus Lambdaproteobacteria bacterium]